jgi:hypothetical protein
MRCSASAQGPSSIAVLQLASEPSPIKDEAMAPDALIPTAEGPELFFGLVAPLGIDLDVVHDAVSGSLAAVGYKFELIKLSGLLRGVNAIADERIEGFMDAADELRSSVNAGGVLVNLAMAFLQDRRSRDDGRAKPFMRTAFVFEPGKLGKLPCCPLSREDVEREARAHCSMVRGEVRPFFGDHVVSNASNDYPAAWCRTDDEWDRL